MLAPLRHALSTIPPTTARQTGITLVEVMVVITIIGTVTGLAVTSYQSMIERKRLERAAESLKSDLQYARTEALKKSRNIVVSRQAGNDGAWCYGLAVKTATKNSCNCHETDTDTGNYCEIKRVSGTEFVKTNLEAAAVNNSTFNSRRGTASAGGVTFSSNKYVVRVVFSDVGRVRLCIPETLPAGKTALPGVSSACS